MSPAAHLNLCEMEMTAESDSASGHMITAFSFGHLNTVISTISSKHAGLDQVP